VQRTPCQYDLLRVLEASRPEAKRLDDPTQWPSFTSLDRAAAALGKRQSFPIQV